MTETKRHFYHHGRSPAAWTGATLCALGFTVASIGAVTGPMWTLIWIGAALIVASMVATLVLRAMGLGQP